jgi:hypothetical protein
MRSVRRLATRTTLTIDDDVLLAAKAIAQRQGESLGEVISDLCRQASLPAQPSRSRMRNGVPLLSVRAGSMPVTMELVNQLRDAF